MNTEAISEESTENICPKTALQRVSDLFFAEKRFAIFYLIILILIIGIFVTMVSWVDNQATDKQETIFNEQQALQTLLVRQAMDDHLQGLVMESKILAEHSIPEFFIGNRTLSSVDELFLIEQTIRPEFVAHICLDAKGKELATRYAKNQVGDEAQEIIPLWAERYMHNLSSSPSSTNPVIPPFTIRNSSPIMGILFPIYDNSIFQGVLIIGVDLKPLITRYALPMRSGQYGAGYLLDGNGTILFDHETEIIGQNIFGGMHAAYPDLIRVDTRLVNENNGTDTYQFTVRRGGEVRQKLIAWNALPIGEQKIVIALSAPISEIDGALSDLRMQRSLLTIGIVLFLLLLSAFFFYARQRLLARTAENLQIVVQERTEALSASESKLQAILDSSPIGLGWADLEGTIEYLNPEFTRLFGYSQADLPTLSDWFSVAYPDPDYYSSVVSSWTDNVEKAIRGDGLIPPSEVIIRCKDGSSRHINLIGSAVGGRILVIFTDFTHRKQIEDELRTYQEHLEDLVKERTFELGIAKDQAESANRAKSAFLSRMSHDLRTPLNAILGYSQILKSGANLTEKQRDYLGIIQSSGDQLLTLINELIDIGKIEAEKVDVKEGAFNLPVLLEQTIEITRIKAERKDLPLLFEKNSPLPEYVIGDATKIRQIILNLLDNAVKYTLVGSVLFRVWYRAQGKGLLIGEIIDTGQGIPDENISLIFEPFVQLETGRESPEGVGLGLSITRQLIRLMGGSLEVHSTPGQGSSFRFEIPLVEGSGHYPASESEPTVTGYHGDRKKILIVDDNPINLNLLVSVLCPLGFDVSTAATGPEAVLMITDHPPDLLLLDLVMPGVDGVATIRLIKENPDSSRMRVIGISATVIENERRNLFVAACDEFIPKPIDITLLLKKIEVQLNINWIYQAPETSPRPIPDKKGGKIAFDESDLKVLEELCLTVSRGLYNDLEKMLSGIELKYPESEVYINQIRQAITRYDDGEIIGIIREMRGDNYEN
ncbi:MAG TPA: ATP-binding protein [Methanospirillum sp.]|nr:ATP-binding protein [Methanospirillum sp.]